MRAKVMWTALILFAALSFLTAQNTNFHEAPESAKQTKNPLESQPRAITAGRQVFTHNCTRCHGWRAEGNGEIPSLVDGALESVTPGELFWFITRGAPGNGMPSWKKLPESQRWELVSYLKSLGLPEGEAGVERRPEIAGAMKSKIKAPPPPRPFTDFRFEWPENVRKITVANLPAPYATRSADNGAEVVTRPANVWPKAPPGFQVELFATGLDNPRLIRTAPNGDIFLAESNPGRIRIFRGMTSDGKPEQMAIFATGLRRPYGIAFYPPGPNPHWVYIGQTNGVLRFPYHDGDLKASGKPEHIADLPAGGGHWTRDLQFSPDGKKLFVAVGSASNDDDVDTHPAEKNRADILEMNPDGSSVQVYASGIRNAGGGLAIQPETGELWCSVNERDALGDNLVPDYITHVQPGGFYGWPWWYIGGHQDPRQQGKHPELKDKTIVPDVLLQPHNASLELVFYEGKQFPGDYRGDVFASEHGSWNRSVRAGYEVIRIPLHHSGKATGEYEDFLTGFVLPDGNVWGRPVGITVAGDGSLLVTDDGSDSIWRVSYTGK